jgi:holo-[acyl-carrier protein] synthase
MPARPFPFPFRLGTDICRVDRVLRIICARQSPAVCTRTLDRFLRKILTDGEIVAFRNAKADVTSPTAIAEHLAGRCVALWVHGDAAKPSRWAAKEAIIKAHPRKLFMKDIIVRAGHGSLVGIVRDPPVEHGQATQSAGAADGDEPGQEVLLSISHEREYAIATAVVPV